MRVKVSKSEYSKKADDNFKDLFVFACVIVGFIYGLIFWLSIPAKSSVFVGDASFAMIAPLLLYTVLIFRRNFMSSRGKKGIISLIAWGIATTAFMSDCIILSAIVLVIMRTNYLLMVGLVLLGVTVFGSVFVPYEKVIKETTNSSLNKSSNQEKYLERWKWRSRSFGCFFITGICITGILVMLPFALRPVI